MRRTLLTVVLPIINDVCLIWALVRMEDKYAVTAILLLYVAVNFDLRYLRRRMQRDQTTYIRDLHGHIARLLGALSDQQEMIKAVKAQQEGKTDAP